MSTESRSTRRGSVLGISLIFMVVVAVAGTALLSMSLIHRQGLIRSTYDTRLIIAAEAALNTQKGRFTLVEGIQDDWSAILPLSGWNDISGPITVNGIPVQVQAMSVGTPAVPRARLRAIASAWNQRRVVEFEIKIPNFSDFAMYSGASNSLDLPENFKVIGNLYSLADINLSNRVGIEVWGDVRASGGVKNAPDPAYNFKEGYEEYVPDIEMPPTANRLAEMADAAHNTGLYFYNNTVSIEFVPPNDFIHYRSINKDGDEAGKRYAVPPESVIYVSSDPLPAGGDPKDPGAAPDAKPNLNSKSLHISGTLGVPGSPSTGARVTLACDVTVLVEDNVAYQTLLDNPDLRRRAEKTSEPALGFREMLGVVSANRVEFTPNTWTRLPEANMVTDISGDSGHLEEQYCVDGVYMGINRAFASSTGTTGEVWFNGGMISGSANAATYGSSFSLIQWHKDFRLDYTLPPFFLRAYGSTVEVVSGTWRTYTLP